jgi:hypothetical protein
MKITTRSVVVHLLALVGAATILYGTWYNGRVYGSQELLDNLTTACYNGGVVFEGSNKRLLMRIPAQRAGVPENLT